MALKMGIPFLVEKFKWVPAEFWQVMKDVLAYIQSQPEQKEAIKEVRSQLSCMGIGCVPETKGK